MQPCCAEGKLRNSLTDFIIFLLGGANPAPHQQEGEQDDYTERIY